MLEGVFTFHLGKFYFEILLGKQTCHFVEKWKTNKTSRETRSLKRSITSKIATQKVTIFYSTPVRMLTTVKPSNADSYLIWRMRVKYEHLSNFKSSEKITRWYWWHVHWNSCFLCNITFSKFIVLKALAFFISQFLYNYSNRWNRMLYIVQSV